MVKDSGEVKKTAVESVHAAIFKDYIVTVDLSRRLSIYNLEQMVASGEDEVMAPIR